MSALALTISAPLTRIVKPIPGADMDGHETGA